MWPHLADLFGMRKEVTVLAPLSGKVLVLVDWDNLFFSLFNTFKQEMNLEYRLSKMMHWVKSDIGELLGGYGFVFAPDHLDIHHREMCVKNGFRMMTCPRRKLESAKRNPKTGYTVSEEDTVDETIMWFGELMMNHSDLKCICLVSADSDFAPLFSKAKAHGIQRALVVPTINSLSASRSLIKSVSISQKDGKPMILRLDTL